MSLPPEIPSDIIEKIPASSTLPQNSENIASGPTEESIHEFDHTLDDYPDGGLRAWLVVAGVILTYVVLDISIVLTFALLCLLSTSRCATILRRLGTSIHGAYFNRTTKRTY